MHLHSRLPPMRASNLRCRHIDRRVVVALLACLVALSVRPSGRLHCRFSSNESLSKPLSLPLRMVPSLSSRMAPLSVR